MVRGRITGLFVYPVKGCRGIALDEATVEPMGFAFDRRWLIVRPDGRFMTQRELPALTGIVPEITAGELVLHLGAETHAVGLEHAGPPLEVAIWKSRFAAFTQPDTIDDALSRYLDRPARLVRFDPTVVRLCNPAVSPLGSHAAFSDEFPILLTSTSSLARLNDGLLAAGAEPVPMERFRPNIVMEGLPAWAEDHHPLARTSTATLALVSPCERCIVTTTDQITGERHGAEPIRTLRTLHADAAGKPLFGWNVVPLMGRQAMQMLRIGDEIDLAGAQGV